MRDAICINCNEPLLIESVGKERRIPYVGLLFGYEDEYYEVDYPNWAIEKCPHCLASLSKETVRLRMRNGA
jgi:hypothetical protein